MRKILLKRVVMVLCAVKANAPTGTNKISAAYHSRGEFQSKINGIEALLNFVPGPSRGEQQAAPVGGEN